MELRPLILRSNRMLGSTLVDVGLIGIDDLEQANQIMMAKVKEQDISNVSILTILLLETKALKEEDLITYQVEQRKLGIIHLRNIRVRKFEISRSNLPLIKGTMTLPFDKVGDYYMVATCYALSEPAMKHWRELLESPIILYVTSTGSFLEGYDSLRGEISEEDQEAEAAEAGNATE